jgi:alkylhydroperoxidase/carboxymuconolactone decarboxylase family protein YurZ/quercetin dioxygenase-like cupin family protein
MIKQTVGRDQLGEFAPKFAELNDDILFGEVWSREGVLSLKTRSILTVTVLVSKGLIDSSFQYHLASAKKNGVTRDEMAEILTHVAFYAGWPNAWAAFRMAVEVYKDDAGADGGIFGLGAPNEAYAQYFVGKSYLRPLTVPGETVFMANVTFEPGCRNNWHIHKATSGGRQVLLCAGGRGWYQEWGQEARKLNPGDVVTIPAGVKHWHGAAKDSWFSHVAVEIPGEDTANEWLESVDDEQYRMLR